MASSYTEISGNVFVVSRHQVSEMMISHLGGKIHHQFRGNLKSFTRFGKSLCFIEIDGNKEEKGWQIPIDATIVASFPLTIQQQLLALGVTDLRITHSRRIEEEGKPPLFFYTGMSRVKDIKIITELICGEIPTLEDNIQTRIVPK